METRSREHRDRGATERAELQRRALGEPGTNRLGVTARDRESAMTEPEELLRRGYAEHVRDRRLTQDDHVQAREHGRFFVPPHLARCLAYGSKAIETTADRIHVVDACCGFGTAGLAVLARIGEYRRWKRIRSETWVTVTLIESDAELAAEAADALRRCDGWAEAHNIHLHVRAIVGDMLNDHAAMKSAAGGTAGPPTAVVIVPPVTSSRTERREETSHDWTGRKRAKTGSPYSEFCEAALELLDQGGEICAVTPASWCVSEDYEPFRRRLRQSARLREIHRFKNHATLWGQQSVTFDTMIWFATKIDADINAGGTAPAPDPTPLETITHADRERWTIWKHETEPGRKWHRRPSAAGQHSGCERLNLSEDGLSEDLLRWRLEAARLEDLGLWAQAGSYDDFHGHGRPGAERRRSPERTDTCCARYISAWHIGRRQLHWPATGEDAGRDCAN